MSIQEIEVLKAASNMLQESAVVGECIAKALEDIERLNRRDTIMAAGLATAAKLRYGIAISQEDIEALRLAFCLIGEAGAPPGELRDV